MPGTSRVTGALTTGTAVCIGADTRGGSGIGSGAGSGANLAVRAAEAASKSSSKWGCALIQRAQLRTSGRRLCAKSLSEWVFDARRLLGIASPDLADRTNPSRLLADQSLGSYAFSVPRGGRRPCHRLTEHRMMSFLDMSPHCESAFPIGRDCRSD